MNYRTEAPDVTVMNAGGFHMPAEEESGSSRCAEEFSRFAAGIAARINTPLAIVSGWLQLLGSDNASNFALAEKLRLMKHEADRIAETTASSWRSPCRRRPGMIAWTLRGCWTNSRAFPPPAAAGKE